MVINDKNMARYDVITTPDYHIAGHCCFCRNNDYYRNLCFKIRIGSQKLQMRNLCPWMKENGLV